MIIGYARVSKKGQVLDRQVDCLNEYGIDLNVLHSDKRLWK